jgi:predicted ATPase/DNA-binding XRE family transcriptional regulator/Tfp pilus assembly protein PilF
MMAAHGGAWSIETRSWFMGDTTAPFADLLRNFRNIAELTQEELAERAGLSPDAVSLLERGERRRPHTDTVARLAIALKLSAPERAQFEAVARRAAPLVAPAAQPQIPTPLTTLVGRTEAIERVAELFQQPSVRLVTLTGPGGVGKTRLALAVAERLGDALADGVVFVPLAALRAPDLVVGALATVLGIRERAGQTMQQRLIQALQPRHALLVLDNFEHLLAAALLVSDLLAACPRLTVLVTSRAPLRLAGEQQFAVAPLEVPATWQAAPLGQLAELPAVALFQQRAQAVLPEFRVTPTNGEIILAICRRLDGLPLAIELAAAWSKLLPPQLLLQRLERRLPLLISGPRDLPERQRTMRDTIAWSYDLLNAAEQALLRSLAVFAGGFTLAAAEAVGANDNQQDSSILAELATLVDASLVQSHTSAPFVPEQDGSPRYSMLETVREFALEQLQAQGECASTQQRFIDYFVALAQTANTEWDGPNRSLWLGRLQSEIDNIRAALTEAHACGDVEALLQFTAALWQFWVVQGYLGEGREWVEIALNASGDRDDLRVLRARVTEGAGVLALNRSDYVQARRYFNECLAAYRLLEDTVHIGEALYFLGILGWYLGDYQQAIAYYEQSLQCYRSAGHKPGIARTLNSLGIICHMRGDYSAAGQYYQESLALKRESHDQYGIAASLNNLGFIAYDQGDLATAQRLCEESLALGRELGGKLHTLAPLMSLAKIALQQGNIQLPQAHFEEALAIWNAVGDVRGAASTKAWLGRVACDTGRHDQARALLRESLTMCQALGIQVTIIEILETIAYVLTAQGADLHALSLFAATDALRAALDAPIAPVERPFRERPIAVLRAHLDDAAFAAAWAAGRTMTLEQALTYASTASAEW